MMMSILTHSLLPALSIHIFFTFHLLLLPVLSHYTLIVIINAYRKAWSDIIIKRISENEGDNSEEIKKWQDRMAGFQTKYEDAVKAIEAALT